METDVTLPRPLHDLLHLAQIEKFPRHPADGSFNLDGADRNRDSPRCGPLDFAPYIREGKGGLARRKRNQMDSTQILAAIAAIVVQMTFLLHQHATLLASQ